MWPRLEEGEEYYSSGSKQFNLHTPRRRHMGKSIARGSKKSLVEQCYEDQ